MKEIIGCLWCGVPRELSTKERCYDEAAEKKIDLVSSTSNPTHVWTRMYVGPWKGGTGAKVLEVLE